MIKVTVKGTKEYYKQFKDDRTLETNTTFVQIEQLLSGTEYQFTVSAVTGGGVGDGETKSETLEVSGKLHILRT